MFSLVNAGFRAYLKRYSEDLEEHRTDPARLQAETLRKLVRGGSDTVYGQQFGLEAVTDYEQFREQLPVWGYAEHQPLLERAYAGEKKVLTEEDVTWIATTSGTSGASKNLPLTKSAISDNHVRGGWYSLAALYDKQEDMQIFAGRNLLIGGSYKGLHPEYGLPMGDISAVLIRSIPRIVRPFYIPDIELATMTDYEEKIERIAQLAAKETGVSMAGGVPTWNLPLYRRIMELTGKDNMIEVWPSLRAFVHGGVNFDPYREQFSEIFPQENFIFQEVYNATEGFFAVQDQLEDRGLLLLLNSGMFYEFVPHADFSAGNYDRAVDLGGVERDRLYVMLITTNAGLYRYPMGDLIEFSSVYPFRIKIRGRTQEFINAFGEDFLRMEADAALLSACELHGVRVRDYTVAPVYIKLKEKGRHQWFVEFEEPPADPAAFARTLDEQVRKQNYNYDAKRGNDFAIRELDLRMVPRRFFTSWLREKGKVGGQSKVPRLANNRDLADSILAKLAADAGQ